MTWNLVIDDDTSLPAVVPGCVHLDLIAAGRVAEPYLAANAAACAWVAERDWTYRTTFAANDGDRLELHAASLQGSATVLVNGVQLARHENQHRPLTLDLTPALRAGDNELRVTFESPIREAARLAEERGIYPVAMPGVEPSVHLRQMACAFGWDWAPSLPTVGIVGDLVIRPAGKPHIQAVRSIVTHLNDAAAQVDVVVDLRDADDCRVRWELRDDGGTVVATAAGASATLEVPRPKRWWPRGHGGQPLYELTATLDRDDDVITSASRRIGLRTVRVDTTPDDRGSAFTFVVNDRPIFAKGMNWIPLDQLLPRVTNDLLRRRVRDAVEAGANMLRVWGGGVFEPDAFYDACDEAGVLVWQDFPFACGMYPDRDLAVEVEAESRHQVARLASHACLAIFCGGNETVWFHKVRDGWRDLVGETGWGDCFYFDLLPSVVAELAPTTPYVANSPYGAAPDAPADAAGHGPQHLWDAWNREPAEAYRKSIPRFASEFGFCGPACRATLDAAVGLAGRSPHDPLVVDRLRAVNGQDKLFARLADVFDQPRAMDVDQWLLAGQLMQAWAVRTGVDWFRGNWPDCAGALVWQLHDCWPAVSWSLVDSAGRRKLAWFAARAAMADRRVTVQPRDGRLFVVAVNDTGEPMRQRETLRRHAFDGRVLAEADVRLEVAARSSRWIAVPDLLLPSAETPSFLRCAGESWFDGPHKDLPYPPPRLDVDVTAHGDGYDVRVVAAALVRDVCLFPDRLDSAATVDSALVTLLPGESHTFHVRSERTLAASDLRSWPVLGCANDLRGAQRRETSARAV